MIYVVQSYAESFYLPVFRGCHQPAETLEEPCKIIFIYAYAVIGHPDFHIRPIVSGSSFRVFCQVELDDNATAVERIFGRIHQQIVHNLIQLIGVVYDRKTVVRAVEFHYLIFLCRIYIV